MICAVPGAVTCLVAVVGASPPVRKAELANPGFEEPAGDTAVPCWDINAPEGVGVQLDRSQSHSGTAALAVSFPRPATAEVAQVIGEPGLFPGSWGRIAPGDSVTVTAWYRTESFEANPADYGIMLELLGEGRSLARVDHLPPSPTWRRADVSVTVPDKVPCPGRFGVRLNMRGVKGRIWWDDVGMTRGRAGQPQYTEPDLCSGSPPRPVRLENPHVRVTLDGETGALLELANRRAGGNCLVPSAEPVLPFKLGFLAPEPRHLVPRLASFEPEVVRKGGQAARLTYEFDGARIRVVCLVSVGSGPEVQWVLYVRNDSDLEVVAEAFPLLNGVRIGTSGRDDDLAQPLRLGARVQSPCDHVVRDISYVGAVSMPWMDLYSEDGSQGLYVGSHDGMLLTTALRCFGHGPEESVGLELLKQVRIRPGQDRRLGPVVVALHDGDWHTGARIYRRWADTSLRIKTPPRWIRELHAWHIHEFPHDNETFASIPAIFDRAALMGCDMAHRAGQMVRNGCARFYHLDPQLGTPDEFRAGNDNVRRRGGHMSYYTNGFGWQRLYPEHLPAEVKLRLDASLCPTWEQMAPLVAKAQDGSEIIQYRDRKGGLDDGLIMCPATPEWQEYLRFWIVDKYLRDYHAGCMQIDQVACDYARPCYDPTHGHDQYAVWGEGLAQMLERISTEAKAVDPEFAIWVEGASDVLSQFADMDYYTLEPDAVPMFHYTFPEVKVTCAPSRDPAGNVAAFLCGYAYAFVREPEGRVEREAAGRLRERLGDLLYYASFRDEEGLGSLPEGVQAKVFVHPSAGATLVTVADLRPDRPDFDVALGDQVLPRAPRIAYWYPDPAVGPRQKLAPRAVGDGLKVTVPTVEAGNASPFGVIVISSRELRHLDIQCPESAPKAPPLCVRITCAGKPVPGAAVWVGTDRWETEHDGSLSYRFADRDPLGVYVLRARKEGYLSARATITVTERPAAIATTQ